MKNCNICGAPGVQEVADTFEPVADVIVPLGTRAGCAKHPALAKQFNLNGTITLTIPTGWTLEVVAGKITLTSKG